MPKLILPERRLLTRRKALIGLATGIVCSPAILRAQTNMIGGGIFGDRKVSGGGIALDGTPKSNSVIGAASVTTPSFSTANGSGLICLVGLVSNGSTDFSTPIDNASVLTFTKRSDVQVFGTTDWINFWTAPYSVNYTGTITWGATGPLPNITAIVFAFSGVSTNDGAGNTNTSTQGSFTTTNANDAVVCGTASNTGNSTLSAGWTQLLGLSGNFFFSVGYQIPGATGTYTGSLSAGGPSAGGFVYALK